MREGVIGGSVVGLYRQALHRYGRADGELLAIALLEEQAGLRLWHPPAACGPDDPTAVNPRLLVLPCSARTLRQVAWCLAARRRQMITAVGINEPGRRPR
jgi:hypothetical protein